MSAFENRSDRSGPNRDFRYQAWMHGHIAIVEGYWRGGSRQAWKARVTRFKNAARRGAVVKFMS